MITNEIKTWNKRFQKLQKLGNANSELSVGGIKEDIINILHRAVYPLNSRLTKTDVKHGSSGLVFIHNRLRKKGNKYYSNTDEIRGNEELQTIIEKGREIAKFIKMKDKRENFLKFYRLTKELKKVEEAIEKKRGGKSMKEHYGSMKINIYDNNEKTFLRKALFHDIETTDGKTFLFTNKNKNSWENEVYEVTISSLSAEDLIIMQEHYGKIVMLAEKYRDQTKVIINKYERIKKKFKKAFEPILVARAL